MEFVRTFSSTSRPALRAGGASDVKKNILRPDLVLLTSLLGAAASTLLYARARRRIRQSDIGSDLGPSDQLVTKLLQAYDATLILIETFPPKPRIKGYGRPFVLRSFLRFATVHYIKQILNAIRRHYYARAALGESVNERDRRAVEDFLSSLPDMSFRRMVLLTASGGVVLAAIFS